MDRKQIIETQPVILAGGGDVNLKALKHLVGCGYPVFAADGGADTLLELDLMPKAVIGDMDSIDQLADWRARTDIVEIREQDSTDFEKCLYTIVAPKYYCVGFLGRQFDHSLAALHVLARYKERDCRLIGVEDLMFATSESCEFRCSVGDRVSIFPLETVTFGRSTGLEFPLNGLELQISGKIGTSNRATADRVTIDVVSGTYAVILDAEGLLEFMD